MIIVNADELALLASAAPHQFSKEGILYTKPLGKKANRKSKKINDGFTERWFCLKSNLLFCMKGIDRTSGVEGVIVLERCSIELDPDECGNLFSFVIGQATSDERIYLASQSESDREDWIRSLHTASYECMMMQLESLREQITVRTGSDPITSRNAIPGRRPTSIEIDDPYVEIGLSCNKLQRSDGNSLPNTVIDILSQMPPSSQWHMLGQTEIVENSANPLFMKTIGLDNQVTSPKTKIKLLVYDVRELVSRARTQIGQAAFILEDLLASEKLTLDIIAPDRSQVGAVSIMSWSTTNPDGAQATTSSTQSQILDEAESAAAWQGGKTYRTKKKDQLKFLFANPVQKVFRFPTVNEHELSVSEIMSESKLSFVFPIAFMNFLLLQNNQWRDQINKLDCVKTKSDQKKKLVLDSLESFSAYLTNSVKYLEEKHSRQTFKASSLKGEQPLEVIPLNLHINRMIACNEYTQSGSSYDTITVGAFAVHPRGFKPGGMNKLLKSHSSAGGLPKLTRLSQHFDAVQELGNLRNAIVTCCEDLYRACLTSERGSLESSYANLKTKSSELMDLCDKRPLVSEAMLNFHSSIISDNGATEKGRDSPQMERESRLPPRSTHTQEHWRGAVMSAQKSLTDLLNTMQKCLEEVEPSLWFEMINADKMKCEAFVEKLYSQSLLGLTHSTVQESFNDPFTANPNLMIRYTALRCQALTAALTGVISKVRFSITDEQFLRQLSTIGCLLHFEGLLSCHGSEMGMLEDFIIGVQLLSDVEFRFVESSSSQDDYQACPPLLSGNRLKVCVVIPMPLLVFSMLPESLQQGQTFRVVPVLFNIGINEKATIAESSVGSTALQVQCNKANYEILSQYYSEYEKSFGSITSSSSSPYSVDELLVKLNQNINDSKKKNVEVLQLSAEIARKLKAVRFTSCKSAKDRTAMSVTLEECKILQQEHELSPHVFEKALSCLRSEGVRRQNSFKNTGVMSYAFSSFQLLSFPKAYKPPTGTYGKGET